MIMFSRIFWALFSALAQMGMPGSKYARCCGHYTSLYGVISLYGKYVLVLRKLRAGIVYEGDKGAWGG